MQKAMQCALVLLLTGTPAPAMKGMANAAAGNVETPEAQMTLRSASDGADGWTLLWSPPGELYRRPIADPHRSGFGLVYGNYIDPETPQAGDSRLLIRMGGSYGLFRIHAPASPGKGYQVDIGANFLGQFDVDHSLDNIGWDGIYHLTFTWADGEGLALKLGILHDSSHVGDEYAERTGRRRLGYTREEAVLGVSRSLPKGWRVYGEAGRAYHRSNKEEMGLWRAQSGLDYESPYPVWGGAMAWYAALNCSAYQENKWHGNTALQAGVVLPQEEIGRRYRFGIEYYRGRSPIGEFFRNKESVIGIGLWWDL
jgi:hypothetical protein